MRISLIIPAFNEAAFLPRLIDSAAKARARYRSGAAAIEIIVADNASTDDTAAIAGSRGCRVVAVAERVIGAARNGGAAAAAGEILAFVDADSVIHEDTFNEIERVMADPTIIGGTSGARFERTSLGIKATHAMLTVAAAAMGGLGSLRRGHIDTGVVFCRKHDFVAVGGYRVDRLYTEDVQFLLDLRRLGRTRGQRLARGTNAPAVFSTRKFDKYGDWHAFTLAVRLAWSALWRRDELAKRYWYQDR
jgi:glycosyltransferase involved in cell wall biosynthesis